MDGRKNLYGFAQMRHNTQRTRRDAVVFSIKLQAIFRANAENPEEYRSYRNNGYQVAVDADGNGLLEGFGSYSAGGSLTGSCSSPGDEKFIIYGPERL